MTSIPKNISVPLSGNAQNALIDYLQVSMDWLHAVRIGEASGHFRKILAEAEENPLTQVLNNDYKRKTFWINIYNAVALETLKANPDRYQKRNAFFRATLVTIAGHSLSLDDIEHGILRRSKIKLALGYLDNWFPGRFEKDFRVDRLDYRIHFALNCGARSCPPIAYYNSGKINEQLQRAMIGHLKTDSDYDSAKNKVFVSAFMGWFRADFGGKAGIKKMLREAGVIENASTARIAFKEYDWQLYLDNFRE